MNKFILALFIPLASWAGLPPTTLQGQGQTAKPTTFNYQVPAQQATQTSGVNSLIETGSLNMLANPGFEASTVTTGWTVAGSVTAARETTNKLFGNAAISLTPSAVNGEIIRQSVPSGAAMTQASGMAINWQCNAYVNNANAGPYALCAGTVSGGTFTDGQCVNLATTAGYQLSSLTFTPYVAVGDPGCRIKSTSSTSAQLYVDAFYGGPATGIQSSPIVTDWVDAGVNSITGTTSNPTKGTTSIDRFLWRRVGSGMDVRIEYAQSATGTAGSGDYLFGIPSSTGCTIDTTKVTAYTAVGTGANTEAKTNIVGTAQVGISSPDGGQGDVTVYDSSKVRLYVSDYASSASFGAVGSAYFGVSSAGVRYNAQFWVPCQGWQSGTTIGADQTNYGWTDYTPSNTQGFGTITVAAGGCQHKRDGEDVLIRCKFIAGTLTGSEAQISLPPGLTSANTSKIPTIQVASGFYMRGNTVTSHGGNVLIEPSVTYVTFSSNDTFSATSLNPLSKAVGTSTGATGDTYFFFARVPIQGWQENGKAPQLVNSVISNSNGVENVGRIRANYGSCAITSQSGSWVSSIGSCSSGAFTLNFTSGYFSATPTCVCTNEGGSSRGCSINSISSTSATFFQYVSQTGAADTGPSAVICMGPK